MKATECNLQFFLPSLPGISERYCLLNYCFEWVTHKLPYFFISNGWHAAHLAAVGAPLTPGPWVHAAVWAVLGHHRSWVIPYSPSSVSTISFIQGSRVLNSLFKKAWHLCFLPYRRKTFSFPWMYLFSPEVSPVVRRGVLAKALRKPQGKTCSGFWGPLEEGLLEKGKRVMSLEAQLCARCSVCWVLGSLGVFLTFPAGLCGEGDSTPL